MDPDKERIPALASLADAQVALRNEELKALPNAWRLRRLEARVARAQAKLDELNAYHGFEQEKARLGRRDYR